MENGCLPGDAPDTQTTARYTGATACQMDDWVSVPMKKGDVIFIHKLTPHSSKVTNTQKMHIRWSMDIRYQKRGTPTLGRAFWPSFDARSRLSPDYSETEYEEWRPRLGLTALEKYPTKVPRIDRRVQLRTGAICQNNMRSKRRIKVGTTVPVPMGTTTSSTDAVGRGGSGRGLRYC